MPLVLALRSSCEFLTAHSKSEAAFESGVSASSLSDLSEVHALTESIISMGRLFGFKFLH